MSWPAMVLWLLLVPALIMPGPALIYAVGIAGVFQSLQMLPGDGGGANLLPQTLFAMALVVRVALAPGNVARALEAMIDPRRLALFTGFMVFAALSAVILPRLFDGLIEVIPVTGADLNGSSLLQPRSGNFTQTGYMAISYLTALAFAVIGSKEDVRKHYLRALQATGLMVIATGVLDLVCYRLGMSGLLDPFRTATYALLTDVEAVGAKRVVGLTPEASSYGALCVGSAALLIFLRHHYPAGSSRNVTSLTAIGLLVMAGLSTSTTGYLGGAVLAAVYLVDLLRRMADRRATGRQGIGRELAFLAIVATAGLAAALTMSQQLQGAAELLDKIVFQKSASFSYMQRMMWTRVGWQAFLDSGGIGVGLGSVRTSNWPVSVVASTGAFGALLLFGFLAQRLMTPTAGLSRRTGSFVRGVKLALLPYLAMNAISGTIPDIGVSAAVMIGFLSAGWPLAAAATASRAPASFHPGGGGVADPGAGAGPPPPE